MTFDPSVSVLCCNAVLHLGSVGHEQRPLELGTDAKRIARRRANSIICERCRVMALDIVMFQYLQV